MKHSPQRMHICKSFFFRNAAGRTYRSPRIRVVEIRSRGFPHDGESESAEHSRSEPDSGREESAPAERSIARRRIVRQFQLHEIPTLDEFNRLSRADSAARLAQRAVRRSRQEVRLDGIERANLDTLVAVDAGVFDLPLGHSKQIAEREDRTTRTNVAAPEPRLEQSQSQHGREQRQRHEVSSVDRRHEMPASLKTGLPRRDRKQQSAREDRDRRDETRDQHSARRSHQRRQQNVVFDVNPPAIVANSEPFHA